MVTKVCLRSGIVDTANLMNWFISVSDQDSESYPQFSTRIDIFEMETESGFHSGVNVSKTNCKTMESFNIYENTQLKKAK